MTSLNPHQYLELWLDLQAAATGLRCVHLWGYDAAGLNYWPGADLHPVPTMVLSCRGHQPVIAAQGAQRCQLEPGEALVLAPGVSHRHPQARGTHTTLQLGFRGSVCDYWLFNRQLRMVGKVPIQPYRRIMEALVEAAARPRLHLMQELLDTFLREPRHQQEHLSPALEAMLLYMEYHAHQEISAADIVQASGLAHAQAYALFRDYYGIPPKQALQQRRIDIARAQLRAGASLNEAAVNSGFGTLRKMQRAFQRFTAAPAQDGGSAET